MSDTDTPHISTPNQNEEETKRNETTFSELLESTESKDEHNVSKSAPKTDTEPANGDSEKNQEKCKSLPAEQNDHKTEATTTTCQDLGTSKLFILGSLVSLACVTDLNL